MGCPSKYGEYWLGWLKDPASEYISEARETSFVLGYTQITSFKDSISAAGAGSLRAAGPHQRGTVEWGRGGREPKASFPPATHFSNGAMSFFYLMSKKSGTKRGNIPEYVRAC